MLGVTFGSKHSYNNWGIWLEDTHINPPLPKRYIVDVPARNGLLDLTPELTPTIRFENRTLTFNFRVKAGDWSTLVSQIYGDIHGRTLDVVSDLDPDWHWHGCVTVDDFSSDERTGLLVITVDADPFKLSNTESSYTVNGNGTITCVVDRMEISPAFEITAPTTVIYGDMSAAITSYKTKSASASGETLSFADGTENAVKNLFTDINSVQNFHGYDYPWAGGAGKNKLYDINGHDNPYILNGVTFTKNDDGSITLDGTASANTEYYLSNRIGDAITLPAGTYILSGIPSGYSSYNLRLGINRGESGTTIATDTGSGVTFTDEIGGLKYGCWIAFNSGAVFEAVTVYPMIRISTESASYEPYENICPIIGFDSVKAYVSNKNILSTQNVKNGSSGGISVARNADGSLTINGTTENATITLGNISAGIYGAVSNQNDGTKHIPNGEWVLSTGLPSNIGIRLQLYGTNEKTGVKDLHSIANADTTSGKITIDDTYRFNYIRLRVNPGTYNDVKIYPKLYPYDIRTDAYERGIVRDYTIPLGRTVYGGTLDITAGTLTIKWVCYKFNELEDIGLLGYGAGDVWFYAQPSGINLKKNGQTNIISSAYKSGYTGSATTMPNGTIKGSGADNNMFIWRDYRFTSLSDFLDVMGNETVAYELDTERVIPVSSAEVWTMLGQNNIWTDSGDVSITYSAQNYEDQKFYIADLEMPEGSNTLTIRSEGITKVTYANGRL